MHHGSDLALSALTSCRLLQFYESPLMTSPFLSSIASLGTGCNDFYCNYKLTVLRGTVLEDNLLTQINMQFMTISQDHAIHANTHNV